MTFPYQYEPRKYQLPYLSSNKRFRICVWARRHGKSKTALNEQIAKAVLKKGVYYYFLPTYRQAKSVIWDGLLDEHLPHIKEIVQSRNNSELAIYYTNGSIQKFAGCEDPDKHRGINPIDVVFDEFAEMKEEIWTAIIQPVLRENGGTASFIFTPRGKNHAWKLLQSSKDKPDWFSSIITVNDTEAISKEELQKAREEMPQDLYEQEFECKFHSGAGQFFRRIHENIYKEFKGGQNWQLGLDLAKVQDWTVITPLCLETFYVDTPVRFNQIDYNLQKSRIETEYLRRRGGITKVVMDSTGVGEPVYDDLSQRINVEPFHFTMDSRNQLLRNLQLFLEQDKIKIPNDENLITELESFKYTLKEQGRVKIEVPDGVHDDMVMSLALACWGAIKTPGRFMGESSSYGDFNPYSVI